MPTASQKLTSLMTAEEVEELLIHIIRGSVPYDTLQGFPIDDYIGTTETAYYLVWACVKAIADRCGADVLTSSQFSDRLYHELRPLVELEVLGMPTVSPTVVERVLDGAFSRDARDLDPDYGLELLKRFLKENAVRGQLMNVTGGLSDANDENLLAYLQELTELGARIDSLAVTPTMTVEQEWDAHEERLSRFRGRELVGLKTGFAALDRSTLGLRGLGALGAGPGVGKTALALNIALGVCRHHAVNDAVVVFLSLEMPRDELYSRVKCNLADMEWRTLTLGSQQGTRAGLPLNDADMLKLQAAKRRMQAEQIGTRLIVYDREVLPDISSADQLVAIVRKAKDQAGATRALLIVDYLQILPIPSGVSSNDLEQDRHRIRVMQDVLRRTTPCGSLGGDAVLFISETRKPTKQQDIWGNGLSELMGSARLGYAVDYALLYRRMPSTAIDKHFAVSGAAATAEAMQARGIAPIIVSLEKGRDGMTRGEWPMEFHFWKSIFKEVAGLGRLQTVEPAPCSAVGNNLAADDNHDIGKTVGGAVAIAAQTAKDRSRLRLATPATPGAGTYLPAKKKRPK